MKKRLKVGLATAGLVAAAGVVGASPAAADTCGGNWRHVTVTGAESYYDIWCDRDGYANIEGYVRDTKKDGGCAVVEIRASGETFYFQACGYNDETDFNGRSATRTSTMYVYTYVD